MTRGAKSGPRACRSAASSAPANPRDWVVPYLGDLVGTRLVSALNTRGRRADVAKTIYYRRRAGTPALLEELIGDITGWEGTVVEMFRRLGRARHGLDTPPGPLAGPVSGTQPGGWADLRRPRASQLTGGPFDEYHHAPDVRRHRGGVDGRHNIDRVAFHLYRMQALALTGVTPLDRGDGSYTFDPSGRSIPLYMPRHRPDDWSEWTRPRELDLPSPIVSSVGAIPAQSFPRTNLGMAPFESARALMPCFTS